jgi:hypothetical protein
MAGRQLRLITKSTSIIFPTKCPFTRRNSCLRHTPLDLQTLDRAQAWIEFRDDDAAHPVVRENFLRVASARVSHFFFSRPVSKATAHHCKAGGRSEHQVR